MFPLPRKVNSRLEINSNLSNYAKSCGWDLCAWTYPLHLPTFVTARHRTLNKAASEAPGKTMKVGVGGPATGRPPHLGLYVSPVHLPTGTAFSPPHTEPWNTYLERPRKEPARCHSAANTVPPWCALLRPLSRCDCGGRIQFLFWHTGPASPDAGENTGGIVWWGCPQWENYRLELFFLKQIG